MLAFNTFSLIWFYLNPSINYWAYPENVDPMWVILQLQSETQTPLVYNYH